MLSKEIGSIKGVGKQREKLFWRLGIRTAGDMLCYYPRGYEDRSRIKKIAELEEGESVCVRATACTVLKTSRPRKGLSYQKVTVTDGSGVLFLTWFNHDWMVRDFDLSAEYTYYGRAAVKNGRVEMSNPVIVRENKIEPIYPLTGGLTQNVFRSVMARCAAYAGEVPESLPGWLRERYTLCGAEYALRNIHFPGDFEKFQFARTRLAFEELLLLRLGLKLLKQRRVRLNGVPLRRAEGVAEFLKLLPYPLTNAQKRVAREIADDLAGGAQSDGQSVKVMNRLVQGDVGSGKTVVAAIAMLIAADSGAQAAMMVPTGILAEQHYRALSGLFAALGVSVVLLTGSQTAKQKRDAREKLANGQARVAIGTHALIQDGVAFQNLCLVVTDEQHRFGVKQRAALAGKGDAPHLLVMTATPIPRTLSMILYGDLDVSVIDELPPGRQRIDTFSVDEGMRERVNQFMLKQIDGGRQVYIVCPLVEESEAAELKSASEYAERLRGTVFRGRTVGLVHGKMKAAEKDDVMRRFAAGETDALVSTTVIEVGVNVPNATLMVVENAERFGLSQLHQLRGRVGRGAHRSYCVLFCQGGNAVTEQRMRIMRETNDGFKIAETDLRLRGPGEFFGTRQHGLPELKIANLYLDTELIAKSGEAADQILRTDPALRGAEHSLIKTKIDTMFEEIGGIELT
ncbi:MAG: ATP-dependent DNA helicase RecG [Clostridiales bacterium]|jgi:ATP-dependent DNA helicase RecG|nr:ATP-dependent DNA helicase RecG [Clostridiales bacterium]